MPKGITNAVTETFSTYDETLTIRWNFFQDGADDVIDYETDADHVIR